MSSTRRAWIAAVTVGAVQGLKDQGLCRWNHTLAAASISLSKQLSSSSSSVFSAGRNIIQAQERTKEPEESLRKVMYLSCWGPN